MADAVFMNKEEVDLVPIYYDPVHDFGFYRFDPKAVKFMDIAEIELNPEGAKVGVEIRVVGNDSGEKLRYVLLLWFENGPTVASFVSCCPAVISLDIYIYILYSKYLPLPLDSSNKDKRKHQCWIRVE